jgi:hypothetical protein
MGGTQGRAGRIAEAVLLLLGSLGGAFVLAAFAQTPFLAFFYWVVPGDKSNDGPILVVLALLLLVLVVPIVLTLGLRRVGRAKAVALAIASGPALMLIACAASAWMARLPTSGH